MGFRNVCYVGWSDECNHLHAYIHHPETNIVDEYTEQELELLIADLAYQGKDTRDYLELLEKMQLWPAYLH